MDCSSMGAVTGACHAPVVGRHGSAWAAVSSRPPSPSKNPQSLRWMWAEDYAQELSANNLLSTPVFAVCIHTASRKTGRGIRRCRISPRRAHDTLQPQDESIIVGYYTSAGSAPRPAGRTNVKGALWRETTGLTVPVQET